MRRRSTYAQKKLARPSDRRDYGIEISATSQLKTRGHLSLGSFASAPTVALDATVYRHLTRVSTIDGTKRSCKYPSVGSGEVIWPRGKSG